MRHFAVYFMLGYAAFLSAQIGGDATFRFLELSTPHANSHWAIPLRLVIWILVQRLPTLQ